MFFIGNTENIMFCYLNRNYSIEISEYSIIAQFRKREVGPTFNIFESDNADFRPPSDL